MTATVSSEDAYEQLSALGAGALWRHLGDLFTAERTSRGMPFRWDYRALRPYNGSRTEDAVLFSYTNEPVVRAVGMYREQLL